MSYKDVTRIRRVAACRLLSASYDGEEKATLASHFLCAYRPIYFRERHASMVISRFDEYYTKCRRHYDD